MTNTYFGKKNYSSKKGFTLIELLVVISIIALLVGILMPSLSKAKAMAGEKVCSSNLRQVHLALTIYASDNNDFYPIEPTEHNPHLQLLDKIEANQGGLIKAFYCPQSTFLEKFANNPTYIPLGITDSVVDTPENHLAGNISYVYWSFLDNKYNSESTSPVESKKYWRNPDYFIPRQLKLDGVKWLYADRPKLKAGPSQRWVVTDFFRRGAPFPHARDHANGLNVSYLDGHVELITGKPRDNYR